MSAGSRAAARSALVLVAALGVASGCRDPVAPAQTVYVAIEAVPNPLGGGPLALPPRAITFRYTGRQSSLEPVLTGGRVFSWTGTGDSVTAMVIAPVGQVLSGPVVRVSVPNAGRAIEGDTVRLLQAAAPDYSLVSTLFYIVKLTVQPQ